MLLVDGMRTAVVEIAKDKDPSMDMMETLSNLNAIKGNCHINLWNT